MTKGPLRATVCRAHGRPLGGSSVSGAVASSAGEPCVASIAESNRGGALEPPTTVREPSKGTWPGESKRPAARCSAWQPGA
jgi:hypothetical protein